MRSVVITGIGAVTPLGLDASTTWSAMKAGVSGCAPITLFDASHFKTQFACEVKGFDILQMLDRKEARKLDRYEQLSLWSAREAIQDSGLCLDTEDRTRIGVAYGTGIGGYQSICSEWEEYKRGDGTPRFSPFFMTKIIPNMGAGLISIKYGLTGPSMSVNSACASSTHAIISAADQIRLGRAEVMISGGSEASVHEAAVGGFNALHALSTRNEDPAHACRPFSKSRDGFVLAEGSVTLVLEEKEHALSRGAKIYAELAGSGQTSDAYHITAPDPEGKGAVRVMQQAMAEAGIAPSQVDHINTHGTSTPLGDVAELSAICQVFGEHARDLYLTSTKSMTGHMLGAAGAMEAMATILALREGIVPPTINHTDGDDDENIDPTLHLVFNKAQQKDMQYAMSNTFGFGGHNACLLFKKY